MQKLTGRQDSRAASPFVSLSTHGIQGSRHAGQPRDGAPAPQHQVHGAGRRSGSVRADEAPARRGRRQPPRAARHGLRRQASTRSTTWDHYTSKPLTVERVSALDRAKMLSFYKQRFSNAADFTFFMVGAFKVDDALPLAGAVRRRRCRRPAQPRPASRTSASRFRAAVERAKVEKGTRAEEPDRDQLLRRSARSTIRWSRSGSLAATDVLEIALRDILREELGQTYTRLGRSGAAAAAARRRAHVEVSFGASPDNIEKMTARVLQEVAAAAEGRTVRGPGQPRQGNRASATTRRSCSRTTTGLRRLQSCKAARPRSDAHPQPPGAHRRRHAGDRAGDVQEVLSGRPLHDRHARAGEDTVGSRFAGRARLMPDTTTRGRPATRDQRPRELRYRRL